MHNVKNWLLFHKKMPLTLCTLLAAIVVCFFNFANFYGFRVSPKTLLTFCTNGVLLRTLMAGEQSLSTVTHIIVVSLSYPASVLIQHVRLPGFLSDSL